jgi:hypothetical protein
VLDLSDKLEEMAEGLRLGGVYLAEGYELGDCELPAQAGDLGREQAV